MECSCAFGAALVRLHNYYSMRFCLPLPANTREVAINKNEPAGVLRRGVTNGMGLPLHETYTKTSTFFSFQLLDMHTTSKQTVNL
jgi:hypothetical protein